MEQHTREASDTDIQDDPRARDLLRRAFEKTAHWPADFRGFTADVEINTNGAITRGSAVVKSPRDVSVSITDADLQKWAEGTIAMIAVHRAHRTFDESDGKYSLTLEENGNHPCGRRLTIHGDSSHSYYYLKGDRITQINRTMPQIGFTINVEDSVVTPNGKHLTSRYTVYYYSPTDHRLQNVESVADVHTRIGECDLPATRRIISFDNGHVVTRTLTFTNHTLL